MPRVGLHILNRLGMSLIVLWQTARGPSPKMTVSLCSPGAHLAILPHSANHLRPRLPRYSTPGMRSKSHSGPIPLLSAMPASSPSSQASSRVSLPSRPSPSPWPPSYERGYQRRQSGRSCRARRVAYPVLLRFCRTLIGYVCLKSSLSGLAIGFQADCGSTVLDTVRIVCAWDEERVS